MVRRGTTNYQLQNLLREIETKAVESRFWRRVLFDLRKPSRQRRSVNVYTIDKHVKDGETVLVPGKVLSVGELTKKVTVVAFQFSDEAKRKIVEAQGKILTIGDLLEQNPDGKQVRIMG